MATTSNPRLRPALAHRTTPAPKRAAALRCCSSVAGPRCCTTTSLPTTYSLCRASGRMDVRQRRRIQRAERNRGSKREAPSKVVGVDRGSRRSEPWPPFEHQNGGRRLPCPRVKPLTAMGRGGGHPSHTSDPGSLCFAKHRLGVGADHNHEHGSVYGGGFVYIFDVRPEVELPIASHNHHSGLTQFYKSVVSLYVLYTYF
jgi:hypothetical protein